MPACLTIENIFAISADMARRILHVDLDAFFVAVEQARDPALRGRAVIVGGDPDGRGVVATASYEARVFGVYSGMALRTAKRLAPAAIFLRGNFGEYQRVSRLFHAILADFTPLVEAGGLDEAYLDITGCEAICGEPQAAAASIRGRVRAELGLAVSVGIAGGRTVAKIASDRAKPDGVCEVAAGEEAAFLAPLPLRALPMLGESTERRLSEIGLSTLGQVAALPLEALEGLFGRGGRALGERCRGLDETPVSGRGEAKSISREGTFATDVAESAHLRAVLRGFSESVGAQLRAQGRRARTVTLKLRLGDFTTLSRSLTLKRPLAGDDAIFAAADRLLTLLRAQKPAAVRLIGVGVSNFATDAVQLALEPAPVEREEQISAALDSVRRKYGRPSLQTGRTAFDPLTGGDEWHHERNLGLFSQMD